MKQDLIRQSLVRTARLLPPLRNLHEQRNALLKRVAMLEAARPSTPTVSNSTHVLSEDLKTEISQLRALLHQNDIPPPPPVHLQRRVVGDYSPNFTHSGDVSIDDFKRTLATVGAEISDRKSVLDFGVGCGRVLRRFSEHYPKASLVGADIDGEAISWLSSNYVRFGSFVTLPHLPPTALQTNEFDLAYSISVFTHLSEEMQFLWLEELQRVVAPGGLLLLTVHGDNYIKKFPPEICDPALEKGIFYDEEAGATDGLPTFYKNTYHTQEYVYREWGRYFDILTYKKMGSENHQDMVLCRRRGT